MTWPKSQEEVNIAPRGAGLILCPSLRGFAFSSSSQVVLTGKNAPAAGFSSVNHPFEILVVLTQLGDLCCSYCGSNHLRFVQISNLGTQTQPPSKQEVWGGHAQWERLSPCHPV